MLSYFLQTGEMDKIFSLLYHLFDIRITFFDMKDSKLGYFDITEMSAYCASLRTNPKNEQKCRACDCKNLIIARQKRGCHIYHCHCGLCEAINPLYDEKGKYLGAIVFGQIRQGKGTDKNESPELQILYRKLPAYDNKTVERIAELVHYFAEYILLKEIVRYRNKGWGEQLRTYISSHLGQKLTVKQLADLIGKSESFVSHYFKKEFKLSPRQYIKQQRLTAAAELLQNGEKVYRVAKKMGFYDEFHFSRTFKSFFGIVPSKYR